MSIVLQGWLRCTCPPKKVVGIPLQQKPKRRYCLLRSNGDFLMLKEPPAPEDELGIVRRNSHFASGDSTPSCHTSPLAQESLEWEAQVQPSPPLSTSLDAPYLPGTLSGTTSASGSDTEAPKAHTSPERGAQRLERAGSLLGTLFRPRAKTTPAPAPGPLCLRLDRAVVTGLPKNGLCLSTNDFQEVYTLEAETAEAKAQWMGALQRVCSEHTLALEDLEVLQCIGAGGFGKVYRVRLRHNERVYALKVMDKACLESRGALEEVLNEVAILQTLTHPFIARLYYSFQTADKLCMLLQYLAGGELYTLTRQRVFPEEVTRLHAAQIALALHHLHQQGIVYRDLKPENVVLDTDANCVLTDFGLAHRVGQERADALAGSLAYMAPELLEGPGAVTAAVDWWALGCLVFEVCTGHHPFMDDDGEVLPERVLHHEPELTPAGAPNVSPELRDFVALLLDKNPATRLQEWEALASHPWFRGLDWEAVLARKVLPRVKGVPWRPRVPEHLRFDEAAAALGVEVGAGVGTDMAAGHVDGFDFASRDILSDPPLHPRPASFRRGQAGPLVFQRAPASAAPLR